MKTDPKKLTIQFVIATVIAFLLLLVLTEFLSLGLLVSLGGMVGTAILLFFIAAMVRYLKNEVLREQRLDAQRQTNTLFKELEAFHSIRSFIPQTKLPLTGTRGWAVSPDLLGVVYREIIQNRPQTIVELGSGISSLYDGYLLKALNIPGKVFAIDHSEDFFQITKRNVQQHELDDTVKVVHCEMKPYQFNGKEWQWYNIQNAEREGLEKIDLLLVDGPLGREQDQARYPAVPVLFDRLNEGAVIVVDDYNRMEDKRVVKEWLKEFPALQLVEEIKTEKGAAVLRKG